MTETNNDQLRRALQRLMDGQREALEVLRQALEGEMPTEDVLGDLEDILEGASDDTRAILRIDEGGGRA